MILSSFEWHWINTVADPGEEPEFPLCFRPNWDPKGRKKKKLETRLPLSQGLDDPPAPPPPTHPLSVGTLLKYVLFYDISRAGQEETANLETQELKEPQ